MVDSYLNLIKLQPLVSAGILISIAPLFLIIYKKAYKDKVFCILLIYLIFKVAVDLAMFHYASISTNTVIFFNLSIPVRYALLSSMFVVKIESKLFRLLVAGSIFLNFLFFAWDLFHVNPDLSDLHDHKLLLYSLTLESVLMIFWILVYFRELILSLKINNLLAYPFFWVCSGLLLYYSSFVFIAPIFHYTFRWNNYVDIGFMEYIPNIFEIISMLFIAIGVYYHSINNYAKH